MYSYLIGSDEAEQTPMEEKMVQDKAHVEAPAAEKRTSIGGTEASHASTAFSVCSLRKVKEKAKQDADDMVQTMESVGTKLWQNTVPEEQRQAAKLMHGEVEFTGFGPGGHRAYYLIAPPEMEDADEILRWMFVRKDGWRLRAPNLLLSSYGGRDHYMNWAESATLKNKEAWEDKNAKDAHKFSKKFKSRLEEIAGGVCQAVTECGGWFDTGSGSRGGLNEVIMDGLKVYWSAFGCLAGHKEDNVVFAIRSLDETQFAEEFRECAKPCDEPAAGGKEESQEEAGAFLRQTQIVGKNLEKRVMYPSVNDALFPELAGSSQPDKEQELGEEEDERSTIAAFNRVEFEREVKFSKIKRFLTNAVTHVIFTQNVAVADKLRLKMKSLTTRAVIFANGSMNLINPGVDGKILLEAMTGVPVVCLHNTGGAAEQLGAAVLKRRIEGERGGPHYVWTSQGIKSLMHLADVLDVKPGDKVKANEEMMLARKYGGLEKAVDDKLIAQKDYDYSLPENIPDEQFLILNPAKDSVEKVINKLTLVLSTVQDKEMTEVGYAKAEENRLAYAWEKYALFLYNARIFRRRSRLLYYISSSLALLITALSLLRCEAEKSPSLGGGKVCGTTVRPFYAFVDGLGVMSVESQAFFVNTMLLVMPLCSAFVITLISRLNHLNKWASLESGAVQIQSNIYQYRCRVLAYMPRKNTTMDIEERVEELCERQSTEALTLAQKRQRKKKQGTSKELSRRVTFCSELERINSDAVGSDIRQDALVEPSNAILKEISEKRYESNRAKKTFIKKTSLPFFRYCQKILLDTVSCSWCRRFCICCRKRSATPDTSQRPLGTPLLSFEAGEADNVWIRKGGDWTSNPLMIEDDFLRDDGIGLVTAEDYIHFRFLPMLQYYNFRSQQLSNLTQNLQIATFLGTAVVAGAGALDYEHWVPLIVAFISFMNGILEFENFPSQLRNVNQCLESLTNLRLWWQSLSMVERRMPRNKDILVQGTEMTADAEISAWKKTLQPKVGAHSHTGEEEEEDKKKSSDD